MFPLNVCSIVIIKLNYKFCTYFPHIYNKIFIILDILNSREFLYNKCTNSIAKTYCFSYLDLISSLSKVNVKRSAYLLLSLKFKLTSNEWFVAQFNSKTTHINKYEVLLSS